MQTHIDVPFTAAIDLSTSQFKIVELFTTAHQVTISPANAGYGVLLNKPRSGEMAQVARSGRVKAVAGDTVTVKDYIVSAASGFATTCASGTANIKKIIGRALTSAASGSVFDIDLDEKYTLAATGGLPV